MGTTKKYWTGLSDLHNTAEFQQAVANEFPKDTALDEFLGDEKLKESSSSRRDFLKFMGFSITAASLAACETPVVKSIPYVEKPEDITPGVANYYASTFYDGQDYGSVLVKTREGRPIFIKSNPEFGWNKGINARVNASVLGLYDSARLTGPKVGGNAATWADVDTAVNAALAKGGNVRVLSNTVISPSLSRALELFKTKYAAQHITWDAVSYSGLRKANLANFGLSLIPSYYFANARTIVSVGADFLGTWLLPTVFTSDYAATRKPENGWLSKHYQFEAVLSLAGTNADVRVPVRASEEAAVVAGIYNAVASAKGGSSISAPAIDASDMVNAAAASLIENAGKSLFIAGSNDPAVQELVNATNYLLGNYGTTIDLNLPVSFFQGDDEAMAKLIDEMNAGQVSTLIMLGVNPAYGWHNAAAFRDALAKVGTSVSTAIFEDETAKISTVIAPDNHYLESWNDFSPVSGRVDLAQPTISPLFDTRQIGASILAWSGENPDYYSFIRKTWNALYDPTGMFGDSNWNLAVHNGTTGTATPGAAIIVFNDTASLAASKIEKPGSGWEVVLYQKVGIGAGNQTNNPWLQEMPDPITKATWDNYITMALSDAMELGCSMYISQEQPASLATVTVNGQSVTLPVIAQPGQKKGTIGIALGYGRGSNGENVGKAAFQTGENGDFLTDEGGKNIPVGKNVISFARIKDGSVLYWNSGDLQVVEGTYPIATTQTHHTVMDRTGVLKETVLADYLAEKDAAKGTASFNLVPSLVVHEDVNGDGSIDARDKKEVSAFDLWHAHPVEAVGHRWGMSIDLNSCIGCGACVTACHIENNVPVVGKDEVRRARDMHWMRIDRYYTSEMTKARGEAEGVGKIDMYRQMEAPEENPQTVHMPMMCQHCNHAPCETVCPVAATTHSNEGLNQMAYNRCIGTRYCANNCPYKVRRFNWFNYQAYKKFKNTNPAQDELTRMVLNPDVTVRSRGVMEKCTMCVQRIQAGKLAAKKESRPVMDGEVVSACAEACPTHAITFGDLNDQKTNNYRRSEDVRAYHALEDVGVQPNIFYLTKVRNTEADKA
jgi:molybdopterin-containing oxidoreductase family iron-sulfur binding subunit